MKQHIDIKQLQELSEPAKARLREWKKPEYVIVSRINKTHGQGDTLWYVDITGKVYPLLSIGQLIEFLQSEPGELRDLGYLSDTHFDYSWHGELCDALWEAVKDTLEKQNS